MREVRFSNCRGLTLFVVIVVLAMGACGVKRPPLKPGAWYVTLNPSESH